MSEAIIPLQIAILCNSKIKIQIFGSNLKKSEASLPITPLPSLFTHTAKFWVLKGVLF